ncbi:Uncharacterised protein [Vibrio cholerae]|nr:Uncharacterised protein [Vibrio cholerae]
MEACAIGTSTSSSFSGSLRPNLSRTDEALTRRPRSISGVKLSTRTLRSSGSGILMRTFG